jgi:hypothetical protein
MLCQLVCVDRRYQRMNCFNIRELQGILKRKFFPDLINNSDHHLLMETSMIGLRFKANSNDAIRPEQSLFYNFGITNLSKQKNLNLVSYVGNKGLSDSFNPTFNLNLTSFIQSMFSFQNPISFFKHNNIVFFVDSYFSLIFIEIINLLKINITYTITSLKYTLYQSFSIILQNFNLVIELSNTENLKISLKTNSLSPESNFKYFSDNLTNQTDNLTKLNNFADMSNSVRFNKFNNVLIGYDYKSGHYLSI